MRNHNLWGMSKSIPCWKKSSKGDTWQLMTGLPCKTALKRSLRQICVSSSGSTRNPLLLKQLLSTASLGKPVPDSCLVKYSTIYSATQLCNSKDCIDYSAAGISESCSFFSRLLSENFSFTQETIAQHADMWVAALHTMQQSVLKHVSSAMHALCCHQQA